MFADDPDYDECKKCNICQSELIEDETKDHVASCIISLNTLHGFRIALDILVVKKIIPEDFRDQVASTEGIQNVIQFVVHVTFGKSNTSKTHTSQSQKDESHSQDHDTSRHDPPNQSAISSKILSDSRSHPPQDRPIAHRDDQRATNANQSNSSQQSSHHHQTTHSEHQPPKRGEDIVQTWEKNIFDTGGASSFDKYKEMLQRTIESLEARSPEKVKVETQFFVNFV